MGPEDRVDVLLVEDVPTDAELAVRCLRRQHPSARVGVVENGEQALDCLLGRHAFARRRRQPLPRVVLLDLKLPGMNGVQVLEALRARAALTCLPVVVLSSSEHEDDIRCCLAAGANSYVVKPVDYAAYCKAIGEVAGYWLTRNLTPAAAVPSAR